MRARLSRVIQALALTSLAALPLSAHPGHDEPRPRGEPTRREPAPQQQRTDAPARAGGGGGSGGAGSNAGATSGRRAVKAPHGGTLVRTAAGYAELLADDAGSVSLWWLDAGGGIRPASVALATVVGDGGARAVTLKPVGDRATALVPKGSRSIVLQATVDGRLTTVRAELAKR